MAVGFLFETLVLLNMLLNQSLPTYYVYPSALNGAILWASSYRYSIYNTERGVVVIEIPTTNTLVLQFFRQLPLYVI